MVSIVIYSTNFGALVIHGVIAILRACLFEVHVSAYISVVITNNQDIYLSLILETTLLIL